ncbi:hypothetical protein [Micromonospora vulcania]|uniref:Uncharacterized protein n=1 Tax=Micromonospora vulcania TaxID=1441873 RepID=A0ABW1H5G0_9ACTN
MTAHPEEYNCECHWGSAEELALLKTPDVPLDGELLRRTYWTTDWDYPQELLRRILPQLTRGIVAGDVDPMMATTGPGVPFIRGDWQQWPAAQRDAVREFLDAWWRHVLVEPDAKVPAHEALEFLAEATATLTPWLATWADLLTDPVAQRRLVTAADEWIWDLVCDTHPWQSWHDEDTWCPALSQWVLRHVPVALREHDASARLHDDLRRLALPFDDRWDG